MRLLTAIAVLIVSGALMAQQPPFPRVSGTYQMTPEWSVDLPGEFFRRLEDKDLVLWKPGITCWVNVWNARPADTPQSTYEWRREGTPESPLAIFEEPDLASPRFAYLLREKNGESEVWALQAFTFGESGHIAFSIYFDAESDLEVAKTIWLSVREAALP